MNDNTDNLKELRQAADIVSVISSYLPLTKRGKNYFLQLIHIKHMLNLC